MKNPLPASHCQRDTALTANMSYWPPILSADNSSADIQIISEVLNSEYRIEVASNDVDALAFTRRNPLPYLTLLEARMPDMDGFEVCRRLKQSAITRNIPVIFMTSVQDEAQEALTMDLHAADHITKPYPMAVTRARIRNKLLLHRKAVGNRAAAPPNGHAQVADGAADGELDLRPGKRQLQVLTLVVKGLTSTEIAAQLSVANGTAQVHRENIKCKLGVSNIAGLVKCAIRSGLLQP